MRFLIYFLAIIFLVGIGIPAQAFDNLDGSSIIIEESDGSPTGTPGTLKVTNGSLTDNGDGTFTLSLSAGSGDNVSVDGSPVVDPDLVSTGDIDVTDTANTVTFDIKTGTVSADELDEAGVEAGLEAVLDLQDMQGAVTDAQVPDSITITDNATVTGTQTLTNKTIDGGDSGATTTRPSGSNIVRVRSHNTDCTSLTDGKAGEICYEEDTDNTIYVCEPTSGDCSGAEWKAIAGGGGGSVPDKEITFSALSLQFINAGDSFPAPVKDAGTNIDINVLAFDDTTDECAGKNFIVPNDVDTSGTATFVVQYYPATASTNSAFWDFKHLAVDNDESWDQALTTESDGGCAGINTQDDVVTCEWTETLSNLGWVASDLVEFEVCRDADNASDNLTGDANLITFTVEIPRS